MKMHHSLFLLSSFLLFGCGSKDEPLRASELCGVYVAEYEGGVDQLEVLQDGSYIHAYPVNGTSIVEKGKWRAVEIGGVSGNKVGVVFEEFQFRPSRSLNNSRGNWITEAARVAEHRTIFEWASATEKKIHLCFQNELQWCFVEKSESLCTK